MMGFLVMQIFVYQIHETFQSLDVQQLNRVEATDGCPSPFLFLSWLGAPLVAALLAMAGPRRAAAGGLDPDRAAGARLSRGGPRAGRPRGRGRGAHLGAGRVFRVDALSAVLAVCVASCRRSRSGSGPAEGSRARARCGGSGLCEPLCGHDAGGGHHQRRGGHVGGHRGDHDHLRAPRPAPRQPGLGGGLLEVPADRLGGHRAGLRGHRLRLLRLRQGWRAETRRCGGRCSWPRRRVPPDGDASSPSCSSSWATGPRRAWPRCTPGCPTPTARRPRALRHDVGRAARAWRSTRWCAGRRWSTSRRAGPWRTACSSGSGCSRSPSRRFAPGPRHFKRHARVLQRRAPRARLPGAGAGPARRLRGDAPPGQPRGWPSRDLPPLGPRSAKRYGTAEIPASRACSWTCPSPAGCSRWAARPAGAAALRPLPLELVPAPGRLRDRATPAEARGLALLAVAFVGLLRQLNHMLYGGAAGGRGERAERGAGRSCRSRCASLVLAVLGVGLPAPIETLLERIVEITGAMSELGAAPRAAWRAAGRRRARHRVSGPRAALPRRPRDTRASPRPCGASTERSCG